MAGLEQNGSVEMTYDVVEADDGTVTVRLAGELDITNVEALGSAVAPALARDPTRLIVDVRELHFPDSSAIALLVTWANRVPAVEIRQPPDLLRRVIVRMGLSERLQVEP